VVKWVPQAETKDKKFCMVASESSVGSFATYCLKLDVRLKGRIPLSSLTRPSVPNQLKLAMYTSQRAAAYTYTISLSLVPDSVFR
jgi:hypothetical protein